MTIGLVYNGNYCVVYIWRLLVTFWKACNPVLDILLCTCTLHLQPFTYIADCANEYQLVVASNLQYRLSPVSSILNSYANIKVIVVQ